MGRLKLFNRVEVLEKAIPLFWEKGFSETSVQELEAATGVNKSGLYSEFTNKEDLFLASLRHYLQTRGGAEVLSTQPLGWANIQRFLEIGQTCYIGKRGCFSVNSMRDIGLLPADGIETIVEHNAGIRQLLIQNIEAESGPANAASSADMVLTFFSGLCIEENLHPEDAAINHLIQRFLNILQQSS